MFFHLLLHSVLKKIISRRRLCNAYFTYGFFSAIPTSVKILLAGRIVEENLKIESLHSLIEDPLVLELIADLAVSQELQGLHLVLLAGGFLINLADYYLLKY